MFPVVMVDEPGGDYWQHWLRFVKDALLDRGMISPSDMSLFKGPILRALAARPPYFHNGAAATLEDVVDFYDVRFDLKLTKQEKADLVAFLKAL